MITNSLAPTPLTVHLDLHEALLMHELRAQINQPNVFGRTPLHLAALRGNAAAIEALLDAGADIDARGNHAKHALHYACKAGVRTTHPTVSGSLCALCRGSVFRGPRRKTGKGHADATVPEHRSRQGPRRAWRQPARAG